MPKVKMDYSNTIIYKIFCKDTNIKEAYIGHTTNMKHYDSYDILPKKKGYGVVFLKNKKENIKKFKEIDWSDVAFLSTNSAYNIRSSQITSKFIE
jgi:hypothetical protein